MEDALDEAEAARAYAEQMVEAAHAAQAEAVEAARRAAILHATEASRKEKERLLAEAHEHAEKEMEAARIRAMEIIATAEAGPPAAIEHLRSAGVELLIVPHEPTVESALAKIELIATCLLYTSPSPRD